MIHARLASVLSCAVTTLILAACGGGGSGTATIGGTITGLANGRTLTLQNNSADDFTITGNGATSFTFNFATGVAAGGLYSATVLTQPLGQTCSIARGTANVDSNADTITTIAVTCATTSSVVGTVSGLGAGVAVGLALNGVNRPLAGNGAVEFPGILAAGSTYTITVYQQPLGQTCSIASPTGTVVANTSAVVAINCQ